MDYHGLWTIIGYRGLPGLLMDYGLSWTNGLLWHIVGYCGFLDLHHHEIAWITVYARQASPLTTPKRYDAGMAHTVASIGHVLFCSYCGLLWITIDY